MKIYLSLIFVLFVGCSPIQEIAKEQLRQKIKVSTSEDQQHVSIIVEYWTNPKYVNYKFQLENKAEIQEYRREVEFLLKKLQECEDRMKAVEIDQ